MKLALWQCAPTNGEIEKAFVALGAQLGAAALSGAQILVCPELLLPGYNRPDLHQALAQGLSGPWISRLQQMARASGCGICLGWAERAEDGAVYNAATTIDAKGEIIAHYRKIQLFGPMERASFARGESLTPPVALEATEGAPKVGMLICYDIEFPGHALALTTAGADLILVPTANPQGYEHVQRVLVPSRAHEARAVVAYANYIGQEGDVTYGGLSVIAGPDGQPLAMAGARGEALLVVDLEAVAQIPAALQSEQAQEYRAATLSSGALSAGHSQ